MAFSSGTYSLPGAALNTGDTVSATENNTLRNDMASSFNKTWLRDGTAAATANIPLGGFKLTGLAAATTAGDAVRYEQLPSGSNVLAEGSGGTGTTVGHNGFKNRIINGAMMIDQRNAGASVTNVAGIAYDVDRFWTYGSQASKYTAQQNAGSVTPPAGFTKYLGVTSSSAYTVGSTEFFQIYQSIEGFNIADLAWGTASAAPVTLSFWVRSSLTGVIGGSLINSSSNRSYVFSYTVNVANTWEYKTVTIAGDTSGTWATDNTVGIYLGFNLGSGSSVSTSAGSWAATGNRAPTGAVSIVGTSGATWYITGVQLEKGSTATSFDVRPYGTELALCQRYYEVMGTPGSASNYYCTGAVITTTSVIGVLSYKVEKRAAPTITGAGTWYAFPSNFIGAPTFSSANTQIASMTFSGIGGTIGQANIMYDGGLATSRVFISAEL